MSVPCQILLHVGLTVGYHSQVIAWEASSLCVRVVEEAWRWLERLMRFLGRSVLWQPTFLLASLTMGTGIPLVG